MRRSRPTATRAAQASISLDNKRGVTSSAVVSAGVATATGAAATKVAAPVVPMVASVSPAVTPQEEGAALIMGSSNLKERPRGIMMVPQEQDPLSMAEGWNKKSQALPKPDLLVVSYGGLGTTAFFNELSALGLPLQAPPPLPPPSMLTQK